MKRNCYLVLPAAVALVASLLQASAQIIIDLPGENWAPLLPDTPGQTRQIHVSGGGMFAGLDFRIQVEDAYPEGGGKDGPNIPNFESAVDLMTGTILSGGDPGAFDPLNNAEQFASRTIDLNSPVSANGLLATVTFDTTGIFGPDVFSIKVRDTIGANTQFLDMDAGHLPSTLINGSISVVPEPSSGVAVGALLMACSWLVNRRRARLRA